MAFTSFVVGVEPKAQLAKDRVLSFVDGWLADTQSASNLAFGSLTPKQEEEEFSFDCRQTVQRPVERVASQDQIETGDRTGNQTLPAWGHLVRLLAGEVGCRGSYPVRKAMASVGPFLAIAGEGAGQGALINEGSKGHSPGRVEVNFGLAGGGGTNGQSLLEPVEG
jgi:hypothetical protein